MSILSLQAKGSSGSIRTAVFADGVEIADATSTYDLVLAATNGSGSGESFPIRYSSATGTDTITFGTVQVQPTGKSTININTTVTKINDSVWKKEVVISSAGAQEFTVANKLTGSSVSEYYNFSSISSSSIGYNDSQALQSTGIKITGRSDVLGLQADDGWSAKYCFSSSGYSTPSSGITETFTGGFAITYGRTSAGSRRLVISAGGSLTLRFFYFLSPDTTLKSFQRYAQLAYAEGRGKTGSELEKLLFTSASSQMRIMNTNDQRAFAQPSYWYRMGQWTRDSFWTSMAIDNQAVEVQLFNNILGLCNLSTGVIPTAIVDNYSVMQDGKDEAPMLMLLWAMWLKRKYSVDVLTTTQINQIVNIIKGRCNGSGYYVVVSSGNTEADRACLIDTLNTQGYSTIASYNQGMMAVAYKAALELGTTAISQSDLTTAINAYRSMYSNGRLEVMWRVISGVNTPVGAMSQTDYYGDFFCHFLFGTTFLTAQEFSSIYAKFRNSETGYGMKYVCMPDGTYTPALTSWWTNNTTTQGDYLNGGSWFMGEYITYYLAKVFQCESDSVIVGRWNNRVSIDTGVSYNLHEYIKTSGSGIGDSDPMRFVYGWNGIALPTISAFSTITGTGSALFTIPAFTSSFTIATATFGNIKSGSFSITNLNLSFALTFTIASSSNKGIKYYSNGSWARAPTKMFISNQWVEKSTIN